MITDAGDHPNVAHVVYVAAFAIEGDENVLSAAGLVAATPATEGSSLSVADAIIGAEVGTSTLTPEGVAQLCYNECDAPTQAWAQQRVGKQSFATMSQTARRNAREHIASTYVVCTLDRIVPVALQRVFAQRCTNSVELATDHSPFASMPDTFTETLLAIAAGAGL